jgi:hypothetical protein
VKLEVRDPNDCLEGSYECSICWESTRRDAGVLTCSSCPSVRTVHAHCEDRDHTTCPQCNKDLVPLVRGQVVDGTEVIDLAS